MKRHGWFLALCFASATFVGCGSGTADSAADAHKNHAHAKSDSHELADAAPVAIDAEPQEVVDAFLKAVVSGDDRAVTLLLTDIAREETEREDLTPQPPGSPSARYTIDKVEFVSAARNGAHVKSKWTDVDEDGQIQKYEITWVLKKQPHNGWRVAGMKTKVVPEDPEIFLNFENPRDMIQKWQAAQEVLAEREQASAANQAQNQSSGGSTSSPR